MKTKTFCVGLTGGIGSGKTTVANYFERLGTPVIDADIIAQQVIHPTQPTYQTIIEHFGYQILNEDQTLNRRKLRQIIFSYPKQKLWLEKLLHPIIRQTIKTQIDQLSAPYCICVIPLLTESTGIDFIDHVLVVEATQELQLSRAAKRDKTTEALIKKIAQTQASDKERRAIADDVIINNGTLKDLEQQIEALHKKYSNTA